MTTRADYMPGPASGTHIEKSGVGTDAEKWTLVVERHLRHSPEKVWTALTDPAQLSHWAPFDADKSLDRAGATVSLTTVGAPVPLVSEVKIKRADAPTALEYSWGGNEMRWELEPEGSGTKLTLWHNIDRGFIAMGAAGWHVCLDVMDHLLDEAPIGRIVAGDAMQFSGWQRLFVEYKKQFGIE